jgi:hypothetical protein
MWSTDRGRMRSSLGIEDIEEQNIKINSVGGER